MDWTSVGWDLLYLSPAIPLALVWQSIILSPQSRRFPIWCPASIGTASVAWMAVAMISQSVLGPGYSTLRGWIIVGNLLAAALCAIASFVLAIFPIARRLHVITGAACTVIGLCWLLTLAANSVV